MCRIYVEDAQKIRRDAPETRRLFFDFVPMTGPDDAVARAQWASLKNEMWRPRSYGDNPPQKKEGFAELYWNLATQLPLFSSPTGLSVNVATVGNMILDIRHSQTPTDELTIAAAAGAFGVRIEILSVDHGGKIRARVPSDIYGFHLPAHAPRVLLGRYSNVHFLNVRQGAVQPPEPTNVVASSGGPPRADNMVETTSIIKEPDFLFGPTGYMTLTLAKLLEQELQTAGTRAGEALRGEVGQVLCTRTAGGGTQVCGGGSVKLDENISHNTMYNRNGSDGWTSLRPICTIGLTHPGSPRVLRSLIPRFWRTENPWRTWVGQRSSSRWGAARCWESCTKIRSIRIVSAESTTSNNNLNWRRISWPCSRP